MNDLKLMAVKAKNRLLNKGLRDIYNHVDISLNLPKESQLSQSSLLNFSDEIGRKKYLLDRIKNKV